MPFSQDIADLICERLAAGESLRAIARSGDIPSLPVIYKWLDAVQSFAEQYARARETQAETLAYEALEIADDGRRDYKQDADGREVPDHDHIARSKLRVDQRRWMAGKLKPKVYGDRTQLDISGSLVISEMSEEDLLAELTELVTTGVIKALPAPEPDPNEDLL